MTKDEKAILNICEHIKNIKEIQTYSEFYMWIVKENYINVLKDLNVSIDTMFIERMLQLQGHSQEEIIELMLKRNYNIYEK